MPRKQPVVHRFDAVQEALEKKRATLESIKPDFQVRDNDHARTPEVLDFCIQALQTGCSYEELRRRLGVGPVSIDRRWRIIRSRIVDSLIPDKSEHAAERFARRRAEKLHEYGAYVKTLVARLETLGSSAGEVANEPAFYKLVKESLEYLVGAEERMYHAHLRTKQIKAAEKKTGGVSIIIQNNYHMSRPGDDKHLQGEVKDVTQNLEQLKAAAEKLGTGNSPE